MLAAPALIIVILPLLITAPAYILGRRLLFRDIPQAKMHLVKGGRPFTLVIALMHMALMILCWVWLFN